MAAVSAYRPALDCIVEAAGLPLPTGYDRWAIKSTSADLSTRNGFRWAFPGEVTKVPKSGIDKTNHDACPSGEGDGLSVGLTYAGMASGGYPARTLLLVAVKTADVLGEDENKLRVRAAFTVDILDGEQYASEHLRGAYLGGADLRGADLGEAYGTPFPWPVGFDPEAAGWRP